MKLRSCPQAVWRWALITFIVLLVLGPAAGPAQLAAQSVDTFPVAALLCDHDPGQFRGRDQRFPDGCRWLAGVKLELTTGDAQVLGACITEASGFCHVLAPFGAAVILREDLTTVPAGYAPQQNPIIREVTRNASFIINVAEADIPEPAVDAGTLTIHSRICPSGYDGSDYYGECHSTPPSYAQSFFVEGGDPVRLEYRAGEVDDAGNITFADLGPGDYWVNQGLPTSITRLWVYCSRNWNPDDRLPTTTTTWWSPDDPRGAFRTLLTLDPGANVLCDFYAVPEKSSQR